MPISSGSKNDSRIIFWISAAALFALSLLPRAIYLYQLYGTPLAEPLYAVDTPTYLRYALSLLSGDFLHPGFSHAHMLYPFFLAGIFFIFGAKLFTVRVIQMVLDSLTAVLIFRLSEQMGLKKSAGLLSAAAYCLYGIAIFYSGFILDATLSVFLCCAFLSALLSAKENDKNISWILAGVFLGLVLLLKTFPVLFGIFFPVWYYFSQNKRPLYRKRMNLTLFFLGIFLILAPASLRNHQIDGRWSPFPDEGGVRIYRGNHPGATGGSGHLEGFANTPVRELTDAQTEAARLKGKKSVSRKESSDYWYQKTLEFIRLNPFQYTKLLGIKSALFWNRIELGDNLSYEFSKKFIPLFEWPFLGFGLIAPFGLLGMLLSFRRKAEKLLPASCFVLLYMSVVVLTFVTDRFRLPCIPFIILLGSYAITELISALKSANRVKAALLILFLAGAFLFSHYRLAADASEKDAATALLIYEGSNPYNLAVVYESMGRENEAIETYKKTIILFPLLREPHNSLGAIYGKQGKFEDALREFEKSLKIDPDYPDTHDKLGIVYRDMGKPDDALKEFGEALRLHSGFTSSYNNIGTVYAKNEQWQKAAQAYRQALALNPEDAAAHHNLGIALDRIGKRDEAAREFEKERNLDRLTQVR